MIVVQVKRASLVDSRTAVNDVKFAPRHLGLQLVSDHTYICSCVYVCTCACGYFFCRHHVLLMVS